MGEGKRGKGEGGMRLMGEGREDMEAFKLALGKEHCYCRGLQYAHPFDYSDFFLCLLLFYFILR